MNSKKIIVTGGAGFIGSHTVVELFNSGFEPVIIDNFENSNHGALQGIEKIIQQKVTCHEIDCKDLKELSSVFEKEKEIHGVIHFAANKAVGESVKDPLKYYTNNIQSLAVLLETMKNYKVPRLVFSSSCTVYGNPEKLPVDESSKIVRPSSPYGNTKKICEEIIEDFVFSNPDFMAIALRYFNPIGAHPSSLIGELPLGVPNNLVPFITQAAAGVRAELTVFGSDYDTEDGTCIRDYIHVVDLSKAHVQALKAFDKLSLNGKMEAFNIGTGKGNSVLEVINIFEKVSGIKLPYKFGERRTGDVQVIYGDVQKANTVLNWLATSTLENAIKDAWNWQKKLGKN